MSRSVTENDFLRTKKSTDGAQSLFIKYIHQSYNEKQAEFVFDIFFIIIISN